MAPSKPTAGRAPFQDLTNISNSGIHITTVASLGHIMVSAEFLTRTDFSGHRFLHLSLVGAVISEYLAKYLYDTLLSNVDIIGEC